MLRRLLSWVAPGGALLVAALALAAWAPPGFVTEATRGYPWVAFGVAVLLGAVFHRSRVVVATVTLAVLLWRLDAGLPTNVAAGIYATVLAVLALPRDRGVAAPAALFQLLGAAGAGSVVALLALGGPGGPVDAPTVPGLPTAVTAWSGLPQPLLLGYGVAAVLLGWALYRWRGPVERGMLWSLATVALGLRPGVSPGHGRLFVLAAALILALCVVETSYAMAYRDDLTGLPARRALVRDLEALGGTFTLAMVDVDHFKKFNDRHGHDVGDQVLRMVATRLAKAPGGARAYRYGGEEFTLLLPGRTRDEALPHLEAVRTAVEQARFSLRSWTRPRKAPARGGGSRKPKASPRRLSVTVSVGMADSTGKDPTPEAVLKKADKALYRAKKAGRNRVSK